MDHINQVGNYKAYLVTGNPVYLPRNFQKVAAAQHEHSVDNWKQRFTGIPKEARGGNPANIAFARAMRPGLFPGLDEGGSRVRMAASDHDKKEFADNFFLNGIDPHTQAYLRDGHYDSLHGKEAKADLGNLFPPVTPPDDWPMKAVQKVPPPATTKNPFEELGSAVQDGIYSRASSKDLKAIKQLVESNMQLSPEAKQKAMGALDNFITMKRNAAMGSYVAPVAGGVALGGGASAGYDLARGQEVNTKRALIAAILGGGAGAGAKAWMGRDKTASGITNSPRLTHNLSDRLKATTDRIQGGGKRISHITAPPPAMGAATAAPKTGLPTTPGGIGEDGVQGTQPKNTQNPVQTMPVMSKQMTAAAPGWGNWWEHI